MPIIYEQNTTPSEYAKARQKLKAEKEAQALIVRRLESGCKITRAEFNQLNGHHKMAWARSGQIIS